jgi:proteic killer suppression protein
MIKGWADKESKKLFDGKPSRVTTQIRERALSKLQTLDAAPSLDTLGKVPGNRLESLRGDREGQHSIRINVQYRVCFGWESGDAYEVEVTDCHE